MSYPPLGEARLQVGGGALAAELHGDVVSDREACLWADDLEHHVTRGHGNVGAEHRLLPTLVRPMRGRKATRDPLARLDAIALLCENR